MADNFEITSKRLQTQSQAYGFSPKYDDEALTERAEFQCTTFKTLKLYTEHMLDISQEMEPNLIHMTESIEAKVTKSASKSRPSYEAHPTKAYLTFETQSPQADNEQRISKRIDEEEIQEEMQIPSIEGLVGITSQSTDPSSSIVDTTSLIVSKEEEINSLKDRLRNEKQQIRIIYEDNENQLQTEIIRLRTLLSESQQDVNHTEQFYKASYQEVKSRCEKLQKENQELHEKLQLKDQQISTNMPKSTSTNECLNEIESLQNQIRRQKEQISTYQSNLEATKEQNRILEQRLQDFKAEADEQHSVNAEQLTSKNAEIATLTERYNHLELWDLPNVNQLYIPAAKLSLSTSFNKENLLSRLSSLEADRNTLKTKLEENIESSKVSDQLRIELSVLNNYIDTIKNKLNS